MKNKILNLIVYGPGIPSRKEYISWLTSPFKKDWWVTRAKEYPTYLRKRWWIVVVIALLNILDQSTTGWALQLGFTEKNPFMASLMDVNYFLSCLVSFLGIVSVTLVLIYLQKLSILYVIMFFYQMLVLSHFILIYLTLAGRLVPY